MPKKILHIINKSSYDGVTSYTIRLIKHLPQYDHEILSCYKGDADEEIDALNINSVSLLNKRSINYRHLLLKYIKMIKFLRKNRYDIIHYHNGGIGVLLLVTIFRKKALIIHHLHSGNLIGDNSQQNISIIHLLLLKIISKLTNQVAVADHVFEEYKSKVESTENLKLIKNSVPYSFQKKESISNSVGYIGRFTEEKGFQTFLFLSEKLKTCQQKLNIVAMGETKTNSKYVKLIPPSFSIQKFYKQIDLLMFLSTAPEGLPLVILEAISFDVGVITYPLQGVVEILGDDYPLYMKDKNDLFPKVSKYYSLEFDLPALSKFHKERSVMFNFAKMINSIDDLYQNLIV
ncbi:MAG: glycosyltransferase family 4 protein [Ignavibacteria bacterium]|nr:glycosyltransferase family 4 protein [Ignavibacteria bacterium]MBT8392347.1 glycosyltransferase family 4 protein [Ignavibacteria bacterium]NNL22229.1 glycosyltransferase family 4 protein [Ignavibacteriaceae bacterium]